MKLYTADFFQEISRQLNSKGDFVQSELSPDISLVLPLHRRGIIKAVTITNATSATIYTTPTDRDFFLCSANLSMQKDVTATCVTIRIQCYVDGEQARPVILQTLTLTIDSKTISQAFPVPIRIDRNTAITIESDTNVGNFRAGASISGFLV